MYWLPLIVFFLHILEEYPRFPGWATRHFGATSNAWYVYSHIPIVAVAIPVCIWAENSPPQNWGRIIGTSFMMTLVMNGAFHVFTTFLYREYSPGVITGTVLFFPAAAFFLNSTVREEALTLAQTGVAALIAAVIQVAVIASLFLKMDIDWRFRKR